MSLGFSLRVFEKKMLNIKFHENPSRGNRVVPFGTDGQTDIMTSIVAFRNLTTAPKALWYIMDIDGVHCTAVCFVEMVRQWTSLSRAGIAQWLRHGQDNRITDFEPRQGQQSFIFSEAFRPAVAPTPPPTQWVLVALPRGVNRPTHHKVRGLEWLELYLRSSIRHVASVGTLYVTFQQITVCCVNTYMYT